MKPPEVRAGEAAADGLGPRRLLEGGGDARERSLVEWSGHERVPRASLERLARALALPPEALPPEALPPPALPEPPTLPVEARHGSWLARGAARLGAAGAVALGVGLGASTLASRDELASRPAAKALAPAAPASEAPRSAPAAPREAFAAGTPAPASPAPPSRAREPERSAAPASTREAFARRQTPPAPPAALPRSAPALGLGAELRALEQVQRALEERRPREAARALASYERQFARGELGVEAALLGVEVALASGEVAQARARARALASRPAAARYRERLGALQRAAEAASEPRSTTARTVAGAKPPLRHIEGVEDNP